MAEKIYNVDDIKAEDSSDGKSKDSFKKKTKKSGLFIKLKPSGKHIVFNTLILFLECFVIYAVVFATFTTIVSDVIPGIGTMIVSATGLPPDAARYVYNAGYFMPYLFAIIVLAVGYTVFLYYLIKKGNSMRRDICKKYAEKMNAKAVK